MNDWTGKIGKEWVGREFREGEGVKRVPKLDLDIQRLVAPVSETERTTGDLDTKLPSNKTWGWDRHVKAWVVREGDRR